MQQFRVLFSFILNVFYPIAIIKIKNENGVYVKETTPRSKSR